MIAVVTGAAGFLGCHIVSRLRAEGKRVIALDDLSTPGAEARTQVGVEWMIGDLTQKGAALPSGPIDEIWHLASPASPPLYKARQRTTLRLGGVVLDQILELAAERGARVLFASSSEVYGDPSPGPQREDYNGNASCWGPRSCYDEAKRYGEAMCVAWAREAGVDVKIARIFNTYGPGMDARDGRVMPALVHAALSGGVFELHGGGVQTRSFSYVADTVDGLCCVMSHAPTATPINVGSPHEMSIGSLVEFVQEVLQVEIRFNTVRRQDDHDPMRRCPDLHALRQLGWSGPRVFLRDGILLTAEWMRGRLSPA